MSRSKRPVAPLSLDRADECVRQGGHQLKLTPKAFAVLRHLMEQQGRLVTRDEILAAVWPDTAVTDASLTTCILEIRRALDDDPAIPRYIQTVHRRGYRYIGGTVDAAPTGDTGGTPASAGVVFVGRERELASLGRSLRQVELGQRNLTFIGGEPGIGKTALVEHFVTETARRAGAKIARGQCVEHYGTCEAYLPWFDVLNGLACDYGPDRLAALLRRYAPMWLAQLPWLVDAAQRPHLLQEVAGGSRERMMRELAEVLEAIGVERPLVVVLEDLHWSDPSSIGLLAHLARRKRSARLLVLGTLRPEELRGTPHPLMALKQELLIHGACAELALDFLTKEAVAEYVRSRLPGAPERLAAELHRRTDGNPLFLVNVIDYLRARGALVDRDGKWEWNPTAQAAQADVPDSLKEMIERQLDRLSHDDRRVLEGASVVGAAVSAASVAAVLEESVESAEERLGALARCGSFVRATDRQVWPDGSQSDGYAFIHALYQQVLYERIGTARRGRLHRYAGERLEAAYGARASEIAAELALHFQRGSDVKRAVRYLAQAGENAIRRSAYVEAIAVLNEGLGLLSILPEGTDRDASELQLRVPLGVSYVNTRGYAAPDVGRTFERAHALCLRVSDTQRLLPALRGMYSFAEQRGDLQRGQSVAKEFLHLAEAEGEPAGLVEGHRIMTTVWFHLGNFSSALDHVERGLAFYDPGHHSSHAFLYGQDPGVCCHAWHSWTLWYLGYPDRAVTSARRSIELAHDIGHPFSLSYALNFAAHLRLCRREPALAEDLARESVSCAQEHGLTSLLGMGQVLHGWSQMLLGRGDDAAISELSEGLARWRSTDALLMTPYWMYLLASALDMAGRRTDALNILDDAFAQMDRTGERWFECDLHILKASLIARVRRKKSIGDRRAEAERHLRRALRAATEMQSPSLRLRAATALGQLWRDRRRAHEARHLVGCAYALFSEGFETRDLAEARTTLALLS